MIAALSVGAGGFVGATLRYLLGLLPWQGDFPLITFCINFVGSMAIGIIAEIMFQRVGQYDRNLMLFLKVGVCGGFTTLSSLSLETITLFDKGQYALGGAYALGSLLASLAGVVLGRMIARAALGSNGLTS